MYLTKNKYFATKYAVVSTWFYLALLTGCSDNNSKEVSNYSSSASISSSSSVSRSSASSSPYVGQSAVPAYGYVLSVSVGLV